MAGSVSGTAENGENDPCAGTFIFHEDFINKIKGESNVEVVAALDDYIALAVAYSYHGTMADRDLAYDGHQNSSLSTTALTSGRLPGIVKVGTVSKTTLIQVLQGTLQAVQSQILPLRERPSTEEINKRVPIWN